MKKNQFRIKKMHHAIFRKLGIRQIRKFQISEND